uniref:Rho GTPase activating protein 45b n=1 Tax=Electrophorus electricus TaxID=8005 RepID=A0A4W4HF58_ELEEL
SRGVHIRLIENNLSMLKRGALSILQEQPRRDAVDGPTSSSNPASHLGCPSPVGTLKRPTTLSRHASAASNPLQSWVFGKGQGRAAIGQSPQTEAVEMPAAIEVEDIPSLLRMVARFAEAVEKLKDVVLEGKRPLAHECLGEVLRILRQVIATYPLLNTVETLTAAGKLISQVKGFHYEVCNENDKKDFEKAIETIAVAFSSNVSELLMGEIDSSTLLSVPPTEKSRVNMSVSVSVRERWRDTRREPARGVAEEVDILLQHSEGGVDSALTYTKTISKYMKDVIGYVEKRISLEVEFSKGLQRLYQTCKQAITQPHMPFFSIYSLALEQDLEQSIGVQQNAGILQSQTFLQPLMHRKQEHEKKRKEIKEQWLKAKRKLMESEVNLRRAKQVYNARCEEYDKARTAASRAEEESSTSTAKALDKKKRLEEEARNKAEEAEATYRTCIADATQQQQELEHTKVTVLRQIQELIRQSDQILRSATISYYQIMHMQTVVLPVHYQTLCESSKLYDPGHQYATHVKDLQMNEEPEVHYEFESYSASSSQYVSLLCTHTSTLSFSQLLMLTYNHIVGDISKMARTSSTGTMSSNEDVDDKDGTMATFEASNINGIEPEIVVPTGPFRNVGLSKAAQTHKLRKLRSPAKCRQCDSYVYFQGAECEECFLACHKRCLETLAIQCGHKKLQGRLQLFGQEFALTSANSSDGIPFVIKKCICEIERRALRMKGIYRVNGVKTRVEKLCQAFENGKELVELSQSSPHDISNVLKLYLRQLPEPIVPFRLYNSLMGLAKESLSLVGHEGAEVGKGSDLVDVGPGTDPELLALVLRLREHLRELPQANVTTLRYIARHLRRIAELEDENKMSPSNLGIVFGPSLMRPRPSGATVSLSSLVDYPYQARIVETLIVFYPTIFPSETTRTGSASTIHSSSLQQVCVCVMERPLYGSVGTLGSLEQSLDSDSELDEDGGGGAEEQPLSPTVQLPEGAPDTNLQSPCSWDGEPPALPDSEPPDLESPEEVPASSLAQLNINQSNNGGLPLGLLRVSVGRETASVHED